MQQMTPEMQEKIKNMSPEELREFQKQQCIFCQLISGKIPSKVVYQDDVVFAIMDINPATAGHILLMPKEHYQILPQVPENVISHLFIVAKKLSHAILQGMKAEGSMVFVANGATAGQKAPHFIVHVFPRKTGDGLVPVKYHDASEEELRRLRDALIPKVAKVFGLDEAELRKRIEPKTQEDSTKEQTKQKKEKKESKESEKNEKEGEGKEDKDEGDAESESENGGEEGEDLSLDDISSLFK